MLKEKYPYYLANEPQSPNQDLQVTDKFTGETACTVAMADVTAIDEAIAAAEAAFHPMGQLAPYERQDVLNHCVSRFTERAEELAVSLCIEAGKPIKDSRGEVSRLIDTFRIAAEESVRLGGEVMNLEISPRAKGYRGMFKRTPIGACSFISPFNFPLNLAAHKVAPAIAVGCPFVLKPASRTPIGALIIGEILAETDLPKGAFSILPCHRDGADLFTTDDRLKLLSFTGSPAVGWALKARAGKKKVVLELGGNAACIVDADANLDDAIERLVIGAFYQSGQSCIGVQRVIVHERIYDELRDRFVAATQKLIAGNPRHEETFIGPMISEKEAQRLHGWVEQAVNAGGQLLCGGQREGAMLDATLLDNVPKDQTICTQEAFGPVAVLSQFSKFEDALEEVNDSSFGLQAGIFTRDLYKMQQAWDRLDVGWCDCRRRPIMASRQHALWRCQGQRAGPRGNPFRHGRHDRDSQPRDSNPSATPLVQVALDCSGHGLEVPSNKMTDRHYTKVKCALCLSNHFVVPGILHSCGNPGCDAAIQRVWQNLLRCRMLDQVCQGMRCCDLHLFGNLCCLSVQSSTEYSRKGQQVVDLIREITSPRSHHGSTTSSRFVGHDFRGWIGHRQHDRVFCHRRNIVTIQQSALTHSDEHIGTLQHIMQRSGTMMAIGKFQNILFVVRQIISVSVNRSFRITDDHICNWYANIGIVANATQQFSNRGTSRSGSIDDNFQIRQLFTSDSAGIDQRG